MKSVCYKSVKSCQAGTCCRFVSNQIIAKRNRILTILSLQKCNTDYLDFNLQIYMAYDMLIFEQLIGVYDVLF